MEIFCSFYGVKFIDFLEFHASSSHGYNFHGFFFSNITCASFVFFMVTCITFIDHMCHFSW